MEREDEERMEREWKGDEKWVKRELGREWG